MSSNLVEESKRKAAYQAVEDYVIKVCPTQPNMKIGIGSGSTVVYVVERLAQLPKEVTDKFLFVPTSFQAKQLILEAKFNLGSVEQVDYLDVAIDGADEVDQHLNSIKGGGACQLQEKIVAATAKKFVLIADYRKNSEVLGQQWSKGVPIEIIPYATSLVTTKIQGLGGQATLRMSGGGKAGPVVTDNGNLVIDADFKLISDPAQLEKDLQMIPGVVEVGLFNNMAEVAYFGNEDGTVSKRSRDGKLVQL